jgi:uncharacterized membrane protein YfcA
MLEVSLFLIAFISSFIGIMIPWVSSALSVSSMILLWIPVQIAKTTYQVGNVWTNLWGLIPLWKGQKLRKDLIIPLWFIALISWFIWGGILITIPSHILLKLTGAFMMVLLIINIYSKSLWIHPSEVSRKRKVLGFWAYFFLNIFFSVFPMWSGILYQFLHTFFFRVTHLEARLMWCIFTVPFVIWFIFPVIQSWLYNLTYMFLFTLWWYLGGYVWARSSIKLWNTVLKNILTIWLFVLGIYFMFFA